MLIINDVTIGYSNFKLPCTCSLLILIIKYTETQWNLLNMLNSQFASTL